MRQRDNKGRFIKGGIMQSEEQFDAERAELSDLADAHIEALQLDQEEWQAELDELCDMADRAVAARWPDTAQARQRVRGRW